MHTSLITTIEKFLSFAHYVMGDTTVLPSQHKVDSAAKISLHTTLKPPQINGRHWSNQIIILQMSKGSFISMGIFVQTIYRPLS